MKKLDNRGFTLIELLAVMVILIIITVIAVPSISSSLERTNDNQKLAKQELIISGAELYLSDYKSYRDDFYNGYCYIAVSKLVDGRYVDSADTEHKGESVGSYVYYKDSSFQVSDSMSETASECS